MVWIKNIIWFSLGATLVVILNSFNSLVDTYSCGYMKGYTTHVTYDSGMLVCVWRQNSWPFKTISGIKT